jgi:hypothetical protein
MSKTFEKIINEQLSYHFENIFHNYLAAFRPDYGCQTTLLGLVEDWKMVLDRNEHVAAILMDLSKAFDCLTVQKLEAYRLSENSCALVSNYIISIKQKTNS